MPTLDDEVETTATSPSDETEITDDTHDEGAEDVQRKRTAEARINELLSKNKELEAKLTAVEEKVSDFPVPTPPTTAAITPEVQRAVDHLKGIGKFVTEDELKKTIQTIEDRNNLNAEHIRLVQEHDGSDGRPKYDKQKVEEYMRERAVYDPKVAYEALHRDELVEWEIRKAEEQRKKKPYVEKRGGSTSENDENAITLEKIQDSMKTPSGREWYERNRTKILSLLAQGKFYNQ